MTAKAERMTMSADEAAEELGVNVKAVYALARTDDFPAFHIGRKVRISREGLALWVAEQAKEAR